jgi:hypothetical protein
MLETLKALREAAATASDNFDAVCRKHYVSKWDYYRACEADPANCPQECHTACDQYGDAQHAFYRARDGESGVLGMYGT